MKHTKLIPVLTGVATLFISASLISTQAADSPSTNQTVGLSSLLPNPVLVKGKNLEIKRAQLDDAYLLFKNSSSANGKPVPEDQRVAIESRLLDRLVTTELLTRKASDADKTKAKEAADKFITDSKKRMPSEEMFNLQLKAMGMDETTLHKRVSEQALCNEVLDRELRSTVTISDGDAKKFYDENGSNFEQPEQVRAAHVLIGTKDKPEPGQNPAQAKDLPESQKLEKKKLAESVLKRAKDGEDFAKLAKELSDDPGSKDKGGEYTFGRGQMVPEFEGAAFSMKPGQVSDIVTTAYGYHVIKLLEKLPAKKAEYAQVSSDIKRGLQNREVQTKLPVYLEKLKKEADVQILDESLKIVTQPAPPAPPMPPTAPAPAPGK
jgi:peptidyl-prolyl cis-trans isomerase C